MDDCYPVPDRDGPEMYAHVSLGLITALFQMSHQSNFSRQEFILLSDVLGVSALVDAINNPSVANATETSVLGPFFTEDAHDSTFLMRTFKTQVPNICTVSFGESIASEGKGDYMLVKGRILDIQGKPIPNANIETWETDGFGFYDTQYVGREGPECRGRLKSDENGNYQYRAIVPVSYPIPGDVSDTAWMGRRTKRDCYLGSSW